MMKNAGDILSRYAQFFRKLVNGRDFTPSRKIALRLSKDEDWGFMCTAMDILQDALGAIGNVLKYGLDGPTKLQDTGERYLRLYGVLSATYIQQKAVETLYRITNSPDLNSLKQQIQDLAIRHLRNKLASHSTDHKEHSTMTIEGFTPIRATLGDFHCECMNMSTGGSESVDMSEALEEHMNLMIKMMDTICKKFITTVYKNSRSARVFRQELDDIRIERDGGFVIRTPTCEYKMILHTIKE